MAEQKKMMVDEATLKELIRDFAAEDELSEESLDRVAGGLAGKLNNELGALPFSGAGDSKIPELPEAPAMPAIIKVPL